MKAIFSAISLFFCLASLAATDGVPEKIMGFQPSDKGIFFQVKSGGCTDPQDFTSEVKRSDSRVTELTLIRRRLDPCYSFIPMGVRLKFSYESLGLLPGEMFIVKNENGVVQAWIWKDIQ